MIENFGTYSRNSLICRDTRWEVSSIPSWLNLAMFLMLRNRTYEWLDEIFLSMHISSNLLAI
jgi:hypothetical protein